MASASSAPPFVCNGGRQIELPAPTQRNEFLFGERIIDAAVLHVSTLKPLDIQTIVDQARKDSRLVVVAENHSVGGGLGEAVASVLLQKRVAPKISHIGLPRSVSGRWRTPDAA